MKDEYVQIETTEHLEACPCCGATAALWKYVESESDPAQKVVMCSHGEVIGPQTGAVNEGCPLYMPGNECYRATAREAVRYWNEFAKALTALREGPQP